MGSGSVKLFVNVVWDGLDLSVELVLYVEKVLLVILSDEVDSQTQMAESTRSTDTMEIGLSVLREVEVDHNVHSLDIDTSGEDVSTDKDSGVTVLEIVEYPERRRKG